MTTALANVDHATPCQTCVRPRPGLRWILSALAIVVILAIPFLLVDVPPVLDYPNHLARYVVLAHPDDPVLSQMIAIHWRILPNLGMDVFGAGLLKVLPVHVGGRLLLALSLFAPMMGVVVYHRVAFGRFSYWPLASGIVAYNGIFLLGFMNFLLSVGLALMAAATWLALRRRGGMWTVAGMGAVASAVLFFCHLYGVALFALLIGSQELAQLLRQRHARAPVLRMPAVAAGLVAFALLPALLLYSASPLSGGDAAAGDWKLINKIWGTFTPFMTGHETLTMASGLLVFSFMVLNWRRATLAPGIAFALVTLGIVYVVIPSSINGGTFADVRLALMIGLLIFAGVQPRLTRRSALLVGIGVALLIVVRVGNVATHWVAHRQDLADVRMAIAPVQPGARMLVAHRLHGSNTTDIRADRALPGFYRLDDHITALLLIERRAFWPQLFADPAQQPIDIRPPYDRIANPLMAPALWSVVQDDARPGAEPPSDRYLRNWRGNFDFVLLIDPPQAPAPPAGLVPVVTTDFAILYKIDAAAAQQR